LNLARWLTEPEHPSVVLEVRPRTLGIASLNGGSRLGSAASLELPEGTLRLSLTEPNIQDRDAFRRVLAMALERTGLKGRKSVGLVLPDPVARVVLLPASELSLPGTSFGDLLRFRLKKTVPFDVQEAQVAALPGGESRLTVVGAVARAVLRDYEEALAAEGLEAGLVEISALAVAEAALGEEGDQLLVNWEPGYLSFVLFRSGWPVLVRTLTGPAAEAENVAQEASQTFLYYRERLAGVALARALVRCSADEPGEAIEGLEKALGVPVGRLDPWTFVGGGPAELAKDAGLAGALASLRRARV
jgi:type IV pilus assembly protein PilM